jgi:hypothetical protein
VSSKAWVERRLHWPENLHNNGVICWVWGSVRRQTSVHRAVSPPACFRCRPRHRCGGWHRKPSQQRICVQGMRFTDCTKSCVRGVMSAALADQRRITTVVPSWPRSSSGRGHVVAGAMLAVCCPSTVLGFTDLVPKFDRWPNYASPGVLPVLHGGESLVQHDRINSTAATKGPQCRPDDGRW